MKRTFLSRRNALLSGKSSRLGVAVLLLAILIVLVRIFVPGVFLATTAPIFRLGNAASIGIGNISNGFKDSALLARERDALATQNVALGQENGVLNAKIADLERTLGAEQSAAPGITAGVLVRPPEAPYDTLVVAAGSGAGVAVGDSVHAQGGILIGSVSAVSSDAARVMLLSAPGVSTEGWVGVAHTPITLLGQGGGAFSARVARAASTSVSDAVYAVSAGSMPVGKVAGESGDPSSPIMTLAISSAINLFSISYVVISHAPSTP